MIAPNPPPKLEKRNPLGFSPTRLCSVQQATGCALVAKGGKGHAPTRVTKPMNVWCFFFGIFGCLFFDRFSEIPMDFCVFSFFFVRFCCFCCFLFPGFLLFPFRCRDHCDSIFFSSISGFQQLSTENFPLPKAFCVFSLPVPPSNITSQQVDYPSF